MRFRARSSAKSDLALIALASLKQLVSCLARMSSRDGQLRRDGSPSLLAEVLLLGASRRLRREGFVKRRVEEKYFGE